MGPRNRLLDGGLDILRKGDNYKGRPIVKYSDTLPWAVQNGWTDRYTVWVMDSDGPSEACIRCGPDPPCEGAIISEKDVPGHARWQSAVSCAKMAEPIDLRFGLWTRVGRRKHKFNLIRQVAPTGTSHRIRLNRPSAAAMCPYVILLWPLVIIIIFLPSGV